MSIKKFRRVIEVKFHSQTTSGYCRKEELNE